jgi:hypothetical protein
MLPELYRERYTEFQRSLLALQKSLQESLQAALQTDGAEESNYSRTIPDQWQVAQHFFEQELFKLPPCDLPLEGLQVEIHKQVRLLNTDMLFLRTAKQLEKRRQRLGIMGDRVNLLLAYCDGILTKIAANT